MRLNNGAYIAIIFISLSIFIRLESIRMEELKKKFADFHQEHVFKYYETLAHDSREVFLRDLEVNFIKRSFKRSQTLHDILISEKAPRLQIQ